MPAALDHPVNGAVRVWEAGELVGEEPGRVGRQRLAKALAMIDHRLGMFGIENALKARLRALFFLTFLRFYLLSKRFIFSARDARTRRVTVTVM